ncbi:hypothetical protein [Asticcacaulis sp. YBE204]|uniref:hypothetical protein n=1 Tax=Asticcacaulis sp. YBE204 TaxID=1282363 RepID=UPI0003C3D947|nr:hypothetical protein [Asticcacaulis sp. YBE204]ESQ78305.1 hypothetical protein AEYBE204_14130 [Asticcacaulis sp. YBE204]
MPLTAQDALSDMLDDYYRMTMALERLVMATALIQVTAAPDRLAELERLRAAVFDPAVSPLPGGHSQAMEFYLARLEARMDATPTEAGIARSA